VTRIGLDERRGRAGVAVLGPLVAAFVAVGACGHLGTPAPPALSADEMNDLGLAYHARGDQAAAAAAFRRAALLRPGWVRPLVNLGDALLVQGDVDGAVEAYERARATQPEEPAILNNLAWALLQDPRRWTEAEPLIRRALSQDPAPRGYYLDTLGLLLAKKGELRPALDAFRAALLDPETTAPGTRALVLRHVADVLRRLGDPQGAEACDRRAHALEGEALPGTGEEVGPGEIVC
jgi:tetratricopeptide (TPR) repeat protein